MKKSFFKEYWLMLLIASQPLLDTLAYFTRNEQATAAGYIRLVIMFALPLHLLITLREKKHFILSMSAIGLVCLLHIGNNFAQGYVNAFFDISYAAKTAQLPVLAVCLCYYIRDERMKDKAVKGILLASAICILQFFLAIVTGTANDTYGPGLGISGWVIDDNRCANSIILVTVACAAVFYAIRSKNKYLEIALPALMALVLIMNGTKACYFSIFGICAGFIAFLALEALIKHEKLRKRLIVVLMLTAVVSAAVYPITPRCRVNKELAAAAKRYDSELENILASMGYDLASMTDEEKLNDPVVVKVFGDYYRKFIDYLNPDMFRRFSYEEICTQYKWTTDPNELIDTRFIKRAYAALIFKSQPFSTRLFGIDVSDPWFNAGSDLENDWPAIFYYFGYFGFAMYAVFILYFIYVIIKRLIKDFKPTLESENFFLLLVFALHMGLAQFSGACLRRPNVSIYTAVILALIYYKAALKPVGEENA